jgi:membrane-associated protease RseP (regulator of RpoE activity)
MKFLGILAFAIALLLSVMVHEFGHYITARKFGMKVTEFFLGFGARIWSYRRGETEFGIKAIPAGGYCRIEGMTPVDVMPEGEEDRAFVKANSGRKLIVLGAGSFMHFALGFLLLIALFAGVGVNTVLPDISKVSPGSAAESAGFRPNDRIISINGHTVDNWADKVSLIADSQGRTLSFAVERDGKRISIKAAPTYNAQAKRYILGIVTKIGVKREGLITATTQSARAVKTLTQESFKSLIALPTKVPQLIRETFGHEKRDPNGLVGVVGAARVSGQAVSSDQLNGTERLGTFILLIASLNIFIGLFNLLPLLPLDGGHMAVAIADEVRALFARIRRKARPAPIDVNVLTPVTMAVFAVLAVLTAILLIADIFNPVSLNL